MALFSVGSSTPSDEGFELKSCRLETGDYLSFTPTVSGNRRVSTLSFWMKNCGQSGPSGATAFTVIFSAGSSTSNISLYQIMYSNPPSEYPIFELNNYKSGPGNGYWDSTAVYRDYSAWYHFVLSYNGDTGTVRLFVNGEEETLTLTGDNWLDEDVQFNTAGVPMWIFRSGADPQGSTVKDVYLSEVYWLDGTAVTDASNFAETNALTNQWQPKNPTDIKQGVTFGTNGFYLPFSNDALATSFEDSPYDPQQTYTVAAGKTSLDVLVVAGGAGGSVVIQVMKPAVAVALVGLFIILLSL